MMSINTRRKTNRNKFIWLVVDSRVSHTKAMLSLGSRSQLEAKRYRRDSRFLRGLRGLSLQIASVSWASATSSVDGASSDSLFMAIDSWEILFIAFFASSGRDLLSFLRVALCPFGITNIMDNKSIRNTHGRERKRESIISSESRVCLFTTHYNDDDDDDTMNSRWAFFLARPTRRLADFSRKKMKIDDSFSSSRWMTRFASFFTRKVVKSATRKKFQESFSVFSSPFHGNCALDPIFTNDLHRDEEKRSVQHTERTHLHPFAAQFPQHDASASVLVCSIRVSFLRFSHREEVGLKGREKVIFPSRNDPELH